MQSQTYKHRRIRYHAYKDQEGKWIATALVSTDEGHSMTGNPMIVRGTFTTEGETLQAAWMQAKPWIDPQVPLKK